MASKVSFDKTPQAGDDFYGAAATGLSEDSSGVVRLDVMANDKGGSAKKLYSLDDGNSGARIWITSEGTVAYDSSTWSAAFKAELQHLAPGEFLQDSFTYAIQMGNGALSWATVTLQIAGVNDAPTITSGAQAGSVTEDGDLTATGEVTATDPDNGDHQHFALVGGADGSYGSLALGADGDWTYTLNQGASVDVLAEGEEKHEIFTVRVTDDYGAHADQQVDITVTGTNDAAVITGTDSGAVTEATSTSPGTPTATGDLLAADADNAGDAFQVVGTTATASGFGSYSIDAHGVWTYTLDNGNAAVNALNDGEHLADAFTVHSVDGTAHTVDITINGASDAAGGGGVAVVGTAAGEVLVGGPGNDSIYGRGGMDTMIGDGGSDHFFYSSAAEGIDVIVDFTTGAGGDVLDLHDMLAGFSGYTGTNAFSGGYLLYLPVPGTGTLVLVDPNGGGDDFFSNPLVLLNAATLTPADTANYVL